MTYTPLPFYVYDPTRPFGVDDANLIGTNLADHETRMRSHEIRVGQSYYHFEDPAYQGATDDQTINNVFRAMDATGGEVHQAPGKTYLLKDRVILPTAPYHWKGHEKSACIVAMDPTIYKPMVVDHFSDYLWQGNIPPGGTPHTSSGTISHIFFNGQKTGTFRTLLPNIWLTAGYTDLVQCIVNGSAWHGILFGDPAFHLPDGSMSQNNVILCKFGNNLGSAIYAERQTSACQFRFNTIGASGWRHIEMNGGASWVTDNICFGSGMQGTSGFGYAMVFRVTGDQMCIERNDIRDGTEGGIEITGGGAGETAHMLNGIDCNFNKIGCDFVDLDNSWNAIHVKHTGSVNTVFDNLTIKGNKIYRVYPIPTDAGHKWAYAIAVEAAGGGLFNGNLAVHLNEIDSACYHTRFLLPTTASLIDPTAAGGFTFGQDVFEPGLGSLGFRNWQIPTGQNGSVTDDGTHELTLNASKIAVATGSGQAIGDYGHAPTTQLTVGGGSRSANTVAVLTSLIAQLAARGIVVDGTTP